MQSSQEVEFVKTPSDGDSGFVVKAERICGGAAYRGPEAR